MVLESWGGDGLGRAVVVSLHACQKGSLIGNEQPGHIRHSAVARVNAIPIAS